MLRSLSDIQAFVEVAQSRSFTRAAETLYVTTTAVSKAVARLERDLDTTLFTRTTRSVQLTEEGARFLIHCQAAFEEIQAGIDTLEMMREEVTGPVRISATFVLGRRLAAGLPELAGRYPKLDLQLHLTDQYVDLISDRFDIALRIGDETLPQEHNVHQVVRLRWATIATPRYLNEAGRPAQPRDLDQHPCHAFVNPAGQIIPWQFTNTEDQSFTPRNGVTFNQGELLLEAALAHQGIAQVFDFMAVDYLADGRLVRLLEEYEAAGPVVYAITHSIEPRPVRIKVVLDSLIDLFQDS